MNYVPKTKIRRVNLWGGTGVSKSTSDSNAICEYVIRNGYAP